MSREARAAARSNTSSTPAWPATGRSASPRTSEPAASNGTGTSARPAALGCPYDEQHVWWRSNPPPHVGRPFRPDDGGPPEGRILSRDEVFDASREQGGLHD